MQPIKNQSFTKNISLNSQANIAIFQINPTLATGDVKVSIDNGDFNNITTLPTIEPAGSDVVKVVLTSGEMNGDRITVRFADVSGAEWFPLKLEIDTETTPDVNVISLSENAINSIDLGLSADQLIAFRLLLDQVDTGTVISDEINTATIFYTNMTTGNNYESKINQVLFFGTSAVAENVRVPAKIVDHDLTTGLITLDRALPVVPLNGNAFSITGYQG